MFLLCLYFGQIGFLLLWTNQYWLYVRPLLSWWGEMTDILLGLHAESLQRFAIISIRRKRCIDAAKLSGWWLVIWMDSCLGLLKQGVLVLQMYCSIWIVKAEQTVVTKSLMYCCCFDHEAKHPSCCSCTDPWHSLRKFLVLKDPVGYCGKFILTMQTGLGSSWCWDI